MSKVMSISNVLDSFDPIIRNRNYAPTRTFVTKWDVEIDRNRVKKINRGRDRTAKYFDHFDHSNLSDHSDLPNPVNPPEIRVRFNEFCDDIIYLDTYQYDTHSYDTDSYEQNSHSHLTNTLLSRQPIEITHLTRKRFVHFEVDEDQSLFKRGRL